MYTTRAAILSALALTSSTVVKAEPIPLVSRSIIPTASCPGQLEGQAPFNIPTADMQALAVAIQTNTLSSGPLDDEILIKASHGIVITAGSVQVCVQNNYLFENAHYARTDIALSVAQGMYNCCGGEANLQDVCNAKPWLTLRGDTGLKAIATIGQAGDECKGAPTAQDYLQDGEIVYKTGKVFWGVFGPLLTGEP